MLLPALLRTAQGAHRAILGGWLQDLHTDSVVPLTAVKHEATTILSSSMGAIAQCDNDIGHPTLIQNRIETGKGLPVKKAPFSMPGGSLVRKSCKTS